MVEVSEGLICTNDNCVGCNKCISVCSCPGATIATESEDGRNVIRVDSSRCVACGACFDACEHHAREYKDDSQAFLQDLKNGESISVMVAPAFMANYPDCYQDILGKLKALGANRIFSVAFGADITTWAYLNYISSHDFKGSISQPCPAVVEYIEKYIPELLPKLIPVQSPMMCMAIYAKKHLGITDKLAFIGPCIAKKKEITSLRGKGLISYNVTFDHLMKTLRQEEIAPVAYEDEATYGLGSVYPMAGGLKENIHWFLGPDAFVRQVEGEKLLYQYLEDNKERILSKDSPYTLIDALNCKDGCLCGTGVEDVRDRKEDILIQIAKIKEQSKNRQADSAWSKDLTPKERLANFNAQFSELNLEDYLCSYENKSATCQWKKPDEEELDLIFEDMNKNTAESRRINCSCCGYDTCQEMAEAIFNGFNHKENCIHFIKDVLEDISADYPTVLLINEKNQSVHVIKSAGEDAVKSWIETGFGTIEYNSAIEDYIENYVDTDDQERILSEVLYEPLMDRLKESGRFSTVYLRHSETGDLAYFQLNFTRIEGQNDIVLSFQNVDQFVRDEQENQRKLRHALRDAEQANKAKSTFLANMSHEIRTPINAVLGMDTMILRESNQPNVLEYARNVRSAGNTLLSLINDILDFSKIESGKLEIVNGNYRLDSVINDLMNMLRPKAEDKGLELILQMQKEIPAQLYGDEVRVKQVILNILNNAVKYTEKGSITFSIGYEQETEKDMLLCVAVTDTGIGIKKENMDKLFSPYERLDEHRNKLIEGTGLGLSITQNLLEKMDSVLSVESEYGKGSTFSFKIKQQIWGKDRISQEHLSLAVDQDAEEPEELFHAPNAKILVVDDVEMNIMVAVNLLKRSKIKPDTCLSGTEALEYAEKTKYDIIFLDAMMPGLSGEETLREMRKNCHINDETPIIVLTANALIGAKEQYMAAGFSDYLSKPIDGTKFEKMIRSYLPADKIEKVDPNSAEDNGLSPEKQEILQKLGDCPDIHTENGIKAAGDEETYLTICSNFRDTAASRMDMIRDYFDKQDIPNYTIQVHALKSSARLVGADELSQSAFEMELAGNNRRVDEILSGTPALLLKYQSIVQTLDRIFSEAEAKEPAKKEMTLKKFNRRMTDLSELVEAFDMESAKELFADFDKYKLPQEGIGLYRSLKTQLADVNRDEMILILKDYFGRGNNEK